MAGTTDLTPLLTRVHDQLDADVDLDALAELAGYSRFHFHRLFTRALGETPKRHIERVRLERACYLLAVTDDRVVDIALAVGFERHETFSRAFRRFTGETPAGYRRQARRAQQGRLKAQPTLRGHGCLLSDVDFLELPATQLLAMRRVGSYTSLPVPPFSSADRLWTVMEAHAIRAQVGYLREAWVISYDNPAVTPEHAQRLDACLPVAQALDPAASIRSIPFSGGRYARIQHLGALDSVDQAYTALADGIRRSGRHRFAVGPPLQVFRAMQIGGDATLNHTDVYLPVLPVARQGRRKKRQDVGSRHP